MTLASATLTRRAPLVGSHPVLWVALVLAALSLFWRYTGAPEGLITAIAIYTLYGAGVNLLVGYTGPVPFGASVFFGCATYATAISMLRFSNEVSDRRPCQFGRSCKEGTMQGMVSWIALPTTALVLWSLHAANAANPCDGNWVGPVTVTVDRTNACLP